VVVVIIAPIIVGIVATGVAVIVRVMPTVSGVVLV
jgi:hypothetical protein